MKRYKSLSTEVVSLHNFSRIEQQVNSEFPRVRQSEVKLAIVPPDSLKMLVRNSSCFRLLKLISGSQFFFSRFDHWLMFCENDIFQHLIFKGSFLRGLGGSSQSSSSPKAVETSVADAAFCFFFLQIERMKKVFNLLCELITEDDRWNEMFMELFHCRSVAIFSYSKFITVNDVYLKIS